jgi:sulfofructose kinase
LSASLLEGARRKNIPTVLDAGSLHQGTVTLLEQVDYLVCSEKFARQFVGDTKTALNHLSKISPCVIITLGERGLIWRRGLEEGSLPAFSVSAIDTTGAGDAFHGAFAAALSVGMEWNDVLRYSSAAGALCCTKIGARSGPPSREEHYAFFKQS